MTVPPRNDFTVPAYLNHRPLTDRSLVGVKTLTKG